MDLQVGSLVEHSSWGRGKILALRQPNAEAYFPSLATESQGPTRMVRLTSLSLSSVQSDPLLDHVEGRRPGSKAGAKVKTPPKRPEHNLDQAIEWFSREYPAHFADERFIKGEVALKRAAQQLFADKLGNGAGERLLAAGNFAEIGTLLDAVYRTTKIPSRLEMAAIHQGLKESAAAAHLLEGLLALLAKPNAQSFARLADAVAALPVAHQGAARPDVADRHPPAVSGRPRALHRHQAGDRQAGRRPPRPRPGLLHRGEVGDVRPRPRQQPQRAGEARAAWRHRLHRRPVVHLGHPQADVTPPLTFSLRGSASCGGCRVIAFIPLMNAERRRHAALCAMLSLVTAVACAPSLRSSGDPSAPVPSSATHAVADRPALSPAEALESFVLEPGYRIDLVAAEPLVQSPVAIAFDERGRMYVAENRGYPDPLEGEPTA